MDFSSLAFNLLLIEKSSFTKMSLFRQIVVLLTKTTTIQSLTIEHNNNNYAEFPIPIHVHKPNGTTIFGDCALDFPLILLQYTHHFPPSYYRHQRGHHLFRLVMKILTSHCIIRSYSPGMCEYLQITPTNSTRTQPTIIIIIRILYLN